MRTKAKLSKRARTGVAVGAIVIASLAVAGWREMPKWRVGGAHAVQATSVSAGKDRLVCPQSGSRITIIGDSHVAGTGGVATVEPFGRIMERLLPGNITVELRGAGGDTAEMGARRWLNAPHPAGGLVILAYGSNDAAPRGWLVTRHPVPPGRFEAALIRQIATWQDGGARVIVMAPPPGGSPAMAERLAPYRQAAARVGVAASLSVLDPVDAFGQCTGSEPLLDYDGLHMSAAGHRCLGTWLAAQLCAGAD